MLPTSASSRISLHRDRLAKSAPSVYKGEVHVRLRVCKRGFGHTLGCRLIGCSPPIGRGRGSARNWTWRLPTFVQFSLIQSDASCSRDWYAQESESAELCVLRISEEGGVCCIKRYKLHKNKRALATCMHCSVPDACVCCHGTMSTSEALLSVPVKNSAVSQSCHLSRLRAEPR